MHPSLSRLTYVEYFNAEMIIEIIINDYQIIDYQMID